MPVHLRQITGQDGCQNQCNVGDGGTQTELLCPVCPDENREIKPVDSGTISPEPMPSRALYCNQLPHLG